MDGPAQPAHSETELQEFFDLSIDLLCIVGFDGFFKHVNPSLERTLGYPRAELFSRSVFDVTHADDVERSRQALAALGEGHDVVGFESRVVCADGSVRWLEWNTRTMPERGVVYGVARDTTERRRTEILLREAQRKLEASRDELRVLVKEQSALRRVATLVARQAPPEAVFAAVAREVGEMLGVDATHMGRFDADGTIVSVAQWGGYESVSVGARFPLDGDSVSARVSATGRAARMDSYEDAAGAIAATIRQLGIRFSVGVPISVEGRAWGVMIATSKGPNPFAAETEARLQHFTELVATAIANTEAHTELAASRTRLVAAADEERRRVVRDLHDGAQQRMVHTVITLKLAERELQDQEGPAAELVKEALTHAQGASEEVRELAHGILPSALTRGGLPAAIQTLTSRMLVPVEVDVSSPRLPEPIEATAYFVVAEALTNVAKHAAARHASVTGRLEGGALRIAVRDDGAGGARTDGGGLTGLRDRIATFEGTLTVESPPGGGTVVTATIPLSAPS